MQGSHLHVCIKFGSFSLLIYLIIRPSRRTLLQNFPPSAQYSYQDSLASAHFNFLTKSLKRSGMSIPTAIITQQKAAIFHCRNDHSPIFSHKITSVFLDSRKQGTHKRVKLRYVLLLRYQRENCLSQHSLRQDKLLNPGNRHKQMSEEQRLVMLYIEVSTDCSFHRSGTTLSLPKPPFLRLQSRDK